MYICLNLAVGKVVKFSTDPDILDPECHKLLKRSWPVFAEQPKVTQKLFIKYAIHIIMYHSNSGSY